ncbi:phage portal protein [Frigoribacterium sp. VKM Ac-2836]|uniref:phage portal protein n=1 Tax=Frigoribacterium sp. VKM Ac-2836 TaxID=2739014 RepID=UPI001565E780|nr:phage portal protein [Frigoribacterium sp. VKM Ac-2836]NRD25547.1 phage portal protein [Frigoribacterium sp. VKM Ac-2836]
MTLGTVYRAVALYGTASKQLSFDVYRGERLVAAPAHIRQPNTSLSQRAFIETTVTSLALDGNAFWLVTRDSSGKVLNLDVLDSTRVNIEKDTDGGITGYRSGTEFYRPDRIRHLRLTRVPGQDRALGPIQAAQLELRGAIDTRDYASNWFKDSGVPNGVLKSDQALTLESAKQFREAWEESRGGKHGTAVLGQGLDYKPVFLDPKSAQWLESQRFSTTQVARLFGIPAALLLADVEGTSQTYSNISQSWTEFARFGLTAYISEIEDAFSALVPGTGIVRANYEGLLRADTTTRYLAHQVALTSGFLTPNEVRAIEGLPPLTGGDVLSAGSAPAPTSDTPEVTS